jgi:hypothetical protein
MGADPLPGSADIVKGDHEKKSARKDMRIAPAGQICPIFPSRINGRLSMKSCIIG